MAIDNTGSDFDSIFAEATAEVEGGGGENAEATTKKQNAKIHLGDGEVNDPQADGEEVEEENEDDETDDPDESEEEVSDDETSDDDETDKPLQFDMASHKDELVTVKIDGKEMSVPLGEALNGYMRQSDYTRKSQQNAELKAAADWGKQMRDALLEDPKAVIEALASSFGLQLGTSEEADIYTTDDPELAPVLTELKSTKAELAELRKRAERSDQAQVEAEVRRELAEVQAKYPDFDPHEVLPEAIRLKVGIEEAYFIVQGRTGRKTEVVKASATDAAAKAAAKETKRRKLEKIATGSKRTASSTPTPVPDDLDFADMLTFAFDEAKKK